MARGEVQALDGTPITFQADTLCIHGDNPNAVKIAQAIRAALEEAAVLVKRPA